jgi:hypothetical protein
MTFLTENSTYVIVLSIVGVIAVIAWVITMQISGGAAPLFSARERRLGLVQIVTIGGGRRLLLIRRDNVEHLLMTGGPVDVVIETGIRPAHNMQTGAGDSAGQRKSVQIFELDEGGAERFADDTNAAGHDTSAAHASSGNGHIGFSPRPQAGPSAGHRMGALLRKLRTMVAGGAGAGHTRPHESAAAPNVREDRGNALNSAETEETAGGKI